jgi:hypothetical protein
VSAGNTQKAANPRETRMNAAFPCRFVSLAIPPYQPVWRFDTEEVAGSNPVVPFLSILARTPEAAEFLPRFVL